jgi:hypothetical protein
LAWRLTWAKKPMRDARQANALRFRMPSILGVDLIPFPSNCQPPKILITADIADRIFRVLVAFGNADPQEREGFKMYIKDPSVGGLGNRQFAIRDTYYGVCGFYMCGDEWYCVTSMNDLSPKTNQAVNEINLKLALLRDQIKVELSIP